MIDFNDWDDFNGFGDIDSLLNGFLGQVSDLFRSNSKNPNNTRRIIIKSNWNNNDNFFNDNQELDLKDVDYDKLKTRIANNQTLVEKILYKFKEKNWDKVMFADSFNMNKNIKLMNKYHFDNGKIKQLVEELEMDLGLIQNLKTFLIALKFAIDKGQVQGH